MKQCVRCGAMLPDNAAGCGSCGCPQPVPFPASQQPPVHPAAPPQVQPQNGQEAVRPAAPVQPVPQPVPPYPQPVQMAPQWRPVAPMPQIRRRFTWADVCTVMGFASSIIGYFWASLVLLPLGFVASIAGFRGDKTRALAVAGIVVSLIGLLIKLMMILHDADLLPYWITNGIW